MKKMLIFFALAILSACASSPKTPDEIVDSNIESMKNYYSQGKISWLSMSLRDSLKYQNSGKKIGLFFSSNPQIYSAYLNEYKKNISETVSVPEMITMKREISNLMTSQIITNKDGDVLNQTLENAISLRNLNDTIHILLWHDYELFSSLKGDQQIRIIVDRTIKELQSNSQGLRPLSNLMDYVEKIGIQSNEGKRIASLLPSMRIKRSELPQIEKISPEYFKQRKSELNVKMHLQFKGVDRLAADDLSNSIKQKYVGIEWMQNPEPDAMTLIIEKVRENEKILPERTQTITYSYHQVNVLNAVLLMPNNASYLYDVVTSGAEIEFGFVVASFKGGQKVYDEVVRGKVGGESAKCQNSRIQNVFGGVSAANFVANDDMRNRCSVSVRYEIAELRQEVIQRVTDSIQNIDLVKNAMEVH